LLESIVLGLAGGAIGAAISYFVFNGFTATTMNFQTFSQVTFAFAVTPELLARAMTGRCARHPCGLFPAIRASRLPIAAALRET
jgi:putative ABC transport system permease protein